jgi:hypothetical protein
MSLATCGLSHLPMVCLAPRASCDNGDSAFRPDFRPARIDALFSQAARCIPTQTEGR